MPPLYFFIFPLFIHRILPITQKVNINLLYYNKFILTFIYTSSDKNALLALAIEEHRDNLRNSQSVFLIVMGFSLLRASKFFVFRKMEMPETINHLLLRVEPICYAKKSPFRYDRSVQATI